ncbi:acyl-CoA dehydrogenase family protein [Streptomyces sp. NPDC002588]|uniref:acyl-CoA dehydrogenase family protein n=1 Tax=Streptomyces sp. NPDC002588 TaxID=3154419 RepID=UPI003330A6E7
MEEPDAIATEAVETASRLVPLLQSNAEEARRLARPTDEAIEALEDSGLLMLMAPRARGGRQVPLSTFIDVGEELARGCASTTWVASIYSGTLYMVAGFSDEAQDEVYSVGTPKTLAAFNPAGEAMPVSGGYRLTGTWRFCSGQHHADWALLSSLIMRDGLPPTPAQFLVPRGECRSADDWQVSGLSGTGSASLSTDGVFVPEHRVLPFADPTKVLSLSETLADDPYFRMPFIPFFATGATGTPLGMARAALDLMKDRIQKRGITYTQYTRQADATITHFQMDSAVMKLDQARFHSERAAATVALVAEDPSDTALRVRCRADAAWTASLCREVVEIVQQASGASAIHRKDPLSRIVSDIQALSVHSFILHSTNAELHGRVLCGLEPGVAFI